ncbi:hypothetical protein [Streptomyces sp. SAI-170]|uniref:hypothetical protein n=1 Tax=Streptomyces sp. SAI-170 TaxID=3377729 RepID=UPI003C7C9C08
MAGPAAALIESSGALGTTSYTGGLRLSQPHMALPALLAAAEPDPLRAALDAVHAAVTAYGEDYPSLLAEVRACLEVTRP